MVDIWAPLKPKGVGFRFIGSYVDHYFWVSFRSERYSEGDR